MMNFDEELTEQYAVKNHFLKHVEIFYWRHWYKLKIKKTVNDSRERKNDIFDGSIS
jgi:hypothetical protein